MRIQRLMRLAVYTTAVLMACVGFASEARAEMAISACAPSEYTAAIGSAQSSAGPKGSGGPTQLTLLLAGDTGFNPKDAPVSATGFTKNRQSLTYAESLSGISGEVDGDLAFLNLETVVTDRNDLEPEMKGQTSPYNFRSHPAGLNALVGTGFNLFSLANNHSMDYGPTGAEETLYHMAVANAANGKGKAIAYAGLGADFEEATRPSCLDIDGMKIGFTATGIITRQQAEHRAGEGKPGQAAYRRRDDFEIVVNRLRELPADYRILSVHYGVEGRVVPDKRQLDDWRDFAARERSIDLIVGHHPPCSPGYRTGRERSHLLWTRQFSPPRHGSDATLRHVPRLRAHGKGASREVGGGLDGRRNRSNPDRQHSYLPGAFFAARRRAPHFCSELFGASARGLRRRRRHRLHAAPRWDGALLRGGVRVARRQSGRTLRIMDARTANSSTARPKLSGRVRRQAILRRRPQEEAQQYHLRVRAVLAETYRSMPPVAFATPATTFSATASISSSVSVLSRG